MQHKVVTLEQWIDYVFDHPVTEPAWHWSADAPNLDLGAERTATVIAETFERGGELLARFSDAQLNQGFWFLISNSCSDSMFCLTDRAVPWNLRQRALHSFVPLFEQVMAARCSPHLSHLDEQPANPLNSVCYMWWDIIPIHGTPREPDRAEIDGEVLLVLQKLLAIPHDACQESALHGLGHWQIYYSEADRIIDEFLARSPSLRPELAIYASQAQTGSIQ